MGHFQELSSQGAPSPHQCIQNPVAEYKTWLSLLKEASIYHSYISHSLFSLHPTILLDLGSLSSPFLHLRVHAERGITPTPVGFWSEWREWFFPKTSSKHTNCHGGISETGLFYEVHLPNIGAALRSCTVSVCFVHAAVFLIFLW